jgi:hypothetical protein
MMSYSKSCLNRTILHVSFTTIYLLEVSHCDGAHTQVNHSLCLHVKICKPTKVLPLGFLFKVLISEKYLIRFTTIHLK